MFSSEGQVKRGYTNVLIIITYTCFNRSICILIRLKRVFDLINLQSSLEILRGCLETADGPMLDLNPDMRELSSLNSMLMRSGF